MSVYEMKGRDIASENLWQYITQYTYNSDEEICPFYTKFLLSGELY